MIYFTILVNTGIVMIFILPTGKLTFIFNVKEAAGNFIGKYKIQA